MWLATVAGYLLLLSSRLDISSLEGLGKVVTAVTLTSSLAIL